MKQFFCVTLIALASVGCAPDYLRPTFPTFTPEKPADAKPAETASARSRIPVTPAQITEQNAKQKLNELEAELEADARMPEEKN